MEASSSYLGASLEKNDVSISRVVYLMICAWNGVVYVRFAVTAPWGVEFEKDVFLVIEDDIFVVVGDHDLDGSLLLLWDGLRLDAGLDLAINKVLDEGSDSLFGQFLALVEREFLVLNGFLDSESWPFVNFEVQVAGVSTE